LWAIKPAEEGINNGIITRVWNLSNANAAPVLNFSLFINSAQRTTHVETNMNDNPYNGRDLLTAIGSNEMKTYRVKLSAIALPVKLISFNGNKVQEANVLKWTTADESSFKSYELQRSTDGQQFAAIAMVQAKLGAVNDYSLTDNNINAATNYYYRLKMINSDNSFSYSGTILIKAGKDAYNIVLYPNPVHEMLKINLLLDKQTRCNITVINAAGAVVKTTAPPLFERGNNYYSLSVSDLPAGEYILSVTAGDKKYVKNFIKN
jgi:Secretion system C-terminal sorting domain/Glycosyl hydrolases family 38 C-terminal beta sandwich domain